MATVSIVSRSRLLLSLDRNSFLDEDQKCTKFARTLPPEGKDVFAQWFKKLRNHQAMVAIDRRVDGMSEGNFGDHKPCRDGVWELRINAGPGYRVYYGIAGKHVVLLLNGGDKSTQSRDIEKACLYWKAWKEEQGK